MKKAKGKEGTYRHFYLKFNIILDGSCYKSDIKELHTGAEKADTRAPTRGRGSCSYTWHPSVSRHYGNVRSLLQHSAQNLYIYSHALFSSEPVFMYRQTDLLGVCMCSQALVCSEAVFTVRFKM